MIIDDFESFRSSLRLMLSSFGAQNIDMASTADDALAKCKFGYYDVILCDFNLGSGKNGQQILEELRVRKQLKHTHIFVMITAETAKDVVLGAREYQPDGYITKPITRTVLEQRLGHLLKQQKILKPINREIDLENYPKAITLCHGLMEQKTRYNSWCYRTLAHLYTLLGDNSSASRIYQNILAEREIPWAKIGMGNVWNIEQQYQKAKDCFKEVITSNPDMIEAYDGMSQSCMKLGQSKQSQDILQEAVNLSPRVIPRQEKLGTICQKNQDIEAATNAYRMAVQYGENSVHEKVEHYLNLGRCLSDWCENDHSEDGKNRAKEAINTLEKAITKFSNNEDSCVIATLIEARIHKGQDKPETADIKLHQAESTIEEDNMSANVGLELAKTLYSVDQFARAEKLLIDLSKRLADKPKIISSIQALIDEPESLEIRQKAKAHNKSGIQQFEQGDIDGAIEAIKAALNLTPKHTALYLNLAQVLVKKHQQSPDKGYLKEANTLLEHINHISEQHHQYKRLQYLRKAVYKQANVSALKEPK